MPEDSQFGRLEIHPGERAITLDRQPVALGARAFDLLLALVSRRDGTVAKNELLDVVWPGLVVEENNLQVQISSLRKLLGAAAITTVPGRGYRFTMAPAEPHAPTRGHASAPAARPAELHTGLPTERPAPATMPATMPATTLATNLPEGLPPLIGRQDDLRALADLVQRGRERVGSLAGSRDRSGLAFARLNLANALLAQGDTAAAREQALLGAPGAALFALEREWADVLAGLAAQQGRPHTAARLCGHADAAYAQRAEVREHNEARTRARAEALARAALRDVDFNRLRQAGGGLDFAGACTLALGEDDAV